MTLPRTASGWMLLVGLAITCVIPLVGDVFYTKLATRILIFGLIAISLNLLVGYTGLVSFGHAAFVGLGAYTVAIMRFHGIESGFVAWPAAVMVAALGALLIGAIALRTSGVYFIMITLALAQMVFYLATGMERYGGDDGIRMRSVSVPDPTVFAYVVLVLFLLSIYGCERLVRSRFGRTLRAIKDNERRARSLGYNAYAYKLAAFALAGALAGLGGALNANLNAHVSPAMLHWVLSGDLLVMLILGGAGTLAGPALGAGAFILLEEFLSSYTRHWMAILGFIMLAVILLRRQRG
jgi:branched-chain amino acid transport system permease protein